VAGLEQAYVGTAMARLRAGLVETLSRYWPGEKHGADERERCAVVARMPIRTSSSSKKCSGFVTGPAVPGYCAHDRTLFPEAAMNATHPKDTDLNDFLLGKLPDAEHAEIEAHLCGCEGCVTNAARLSQVDTLAELLIAANARNDSRCSAAHTPSTPDTPSALDATCEIPNPAADGAPPLPTGLTGHPRYRVMRPLGAGGMGSVWLAQHLVLDRRVAIKVIRPERLASAGATERFRREARAVARLSHPNIVAAFDAEEVVGTHFLVMEYVAGESLADVLAGGPVPLVEACRAVRDAARGLAHAHAAGLAHRDIKPSNLIRTPDHVTKVLDFGLATAELGSGEGLTSQNMVVGTPDYIAPEQAVEAHAADTRSDVYSLGCTLYHLLAGHVPFQAGSVLKKLDAHRHAEPPPLTNVPPQLAALVARMMAKHPDDRPTAAAVAQALGPFCCEPAAAGRSRRRPGRRWLVAAGVLLALAGVAAGAVVYKIQRGRQEITIETNDPDIEVVIRRNGELVRIVDTNTKQVWELDAKKMRLRPDGSELSIDLPGKEPLVIRRKGEVAVVVRRTPAPAAPAERPATTVPRAELLCRIPFVFGGSLDFSPDGKQFLATTTEKGKKFAVIFDTATGKERERMTLPNEPTVWFLPGSTDLLIAAGGSLSRWDRKTGKKRADLFRLPPNGFCPTPPSADGKRVVYFQTSGEGPGRHLVIVYNLETKREEFRVRRVRVGSLLAAYPVFSLNGKMLATVDTIPGSSVLRVWNAAGTLVRSISVKGFACGGPTVQFGRRDHEVIAMYLDDTRGPGREAWFDGTWDLTTGDQLRKTLVSNDDLHSGLLPRNGFRMVEPDGKRGLRFTDTWTGKLAAVYPMHEDIQPFSVSRDGRYFLVATASELHLLRLPLVRGKQDKP
jgi:tRNA A-37 threonylcarbamoyl transferase component Bud32